MASMVKLHEDQALREMGFKLLLQIHDEVVLEGPTEKAQDAKQRVVEIMNSPLDKALSVELTVSAKIAKNWYDAK